MKEVNFKGKRFVFTGRLAATRDNCSEIVYFFNGTVDPAVTWGTTYLVAGEKVGATKMDKASALGVKVISEDEFLKMIGPVGRRLWGVLHSSRR
jgi:DNA ligase (NAD+)